MPFEECYVEIMLVMAIFLSVTNLPTSLKFNDTNCHAIKGLIGCMQ